MIDCLLIHPGGTHGIDPVYGELSKSLTSIEQPLWCRLIAGYLIDKGWNIKIIDQEAEQRSCSQIANYVRHEKPRIVAIVVSGHQPSASTQQMPLANLIATCIKKTSPETTVVMMGNHPSALPERTLMEEPVDYVIDGEGPVTLDLLLRPGPRENIPGLVWDSPLHIIHNPPAPLIPINELHGNAWHLLPPPSSYRAHAWQCLDDQSKRTPYAAIYTSLGCPYTCSFCMINVFQHTNKYRMREPHDVVGEMAHLYDEYGVRTFKIIDELFILNRNHYRAICELLAVRNEGKDDINIWAYARTDTVAGEDLPLLRRAGIKWLALGIESGSAAVRASANKKLKYDNTGNIDIRQTVNTIRANDINVIGNYIFGLPGDTYESMQATLDLAIELNTEFANFYCAMPYPGSELYNEVARTRPDDLPPSWAAYSQHNRYCTPLRNANLTAAEILQFRDIAFLEYFTRPKYADMIVKRFGREAISHIWKMMNYKLDRDILK